MTCDQDWIRTSTSLPDIITLITGDVSHSMAAVNKTSDPTQASQIHTFM